MSGTAHGPVLVERWCLQPSAAHAAVGGVLTRLPEELGLPTPPPRPRHDPSRPPSCWKSKDGDLLSVLGNVCVFSAS